MTNQRNELRLSKPYKHGVECSCPACTAQTRALEELARAAEIRAAGHVFTAVAQPATQYLDRNIEPPMKCTNDPRRRFRCYTCGRVRWAKNMIVHVYYDGTRFFCAEGHVPPRIHRPRRRRA